MAQNQNYLEFSAVLQLAHRDLFQKALTDGKCADVTFKIGKEERSVSGTLLAFISPVFEGMLFGALKNTRPDPSVPIEINHIDPEAFDCIINFAYNNNPKITVKTIFPLILACQRYQMDALYDSCIELLRTNLNVRNFSEYFRFAAAQPRFEDESLKLLIEFFMQNSAHCLNGDNFCWFFEWVVNRSSTYKFCTEFAEKCKMFIDNASNDVAMKMLKSEGFCAMSLGAMKQLLERSVNCKEERIWEAVVRWNRCADGAQVDQKSDSDYLMDEDHDHDNQSRLKSVRYLIRFGLMEGAYFVEVVMPKKVLTDAEEKRVLMYYQVPRGGCDPFSTLPRYHAEIEQLIPVELQMSSEYPASSHFAYLVENTVQSLNSTNYSKGCSTNTQPHDEFVWIEAVFANNVIITEMEIAPLDKWSIELAGVHVTIYDTERQEWNTVESNLEPKKFQNLKLRWTNLAATMRVRIGRYNNHIAKRPIPLSVGMWRFYGYRGNNDKC